MRLLVHAPNVSEQLSDGLGRPDYSYGFVLNHFRPVLEQVGEVVDITDPRTEVPRALSEARQSGQDCVFLSFAPPHACETGLACPTTSVFAWEFDTIPDHDWGGNPKNDWRTVLADHGRAITLSSHSRNVVRDTMGDDFPVEAIPTPIFERVVASRPLREGPRPATIAVPHTPVDSREYRFTPLTIEHDEPSGGVDRVWAKQYLDLQFSTDRDDRGHLVGFYTAEAFGSWSRIAEPWLMLPFLMQGRVRLRILMGAYGKNIGAEIEVRVGDQRHTVRLTEIPRWHVLDFTIEEATNVIGFSGLDVNPDPDNFDVRTMGISLCRLELDRKPSLARRVTRRLRRARVAELPKVQRGRSQLHLDGIVFASVFNPADGRKNWPQLVTAFADALGDRPDATLVLKMTCGSAAPYLAEFQRLLAMVGPLQARIVALHGYLPDLEELMAATFFYVNASSGEGMCMPLMEFMSAGVPAIAPRNTAMLDYITTRNAFVVASDEQLTSWPHDPEFKLRTHFHRVHWDSLADNYEKAYRCATQDPDRQRAMGAAARTAMEQLSGDRIVAQQLRNFLEREHG
ncbi:MAG: glycosyltransferase family 4 protein [Actinobacteria bacterium]|nr:glycosyltransferase family 4 protein [Actinomycetota bacterium]